MKQAIYLYQATPSRGEMLLANDSSSFTLPFFMEAQEILAKVPSLPLSAGISFYPNTLQEDAVMILARTSFHLSEWIFPALIIGSDDSPQSALLINRSHPEHVLVVSLKEKEVIASCLNGAEIREEEGEAMSVKEFLSTLSIASPSESFSPKKQIKPVDLGSFLDEEEAPISEEDDAPLDIHISRPSFVPESKKGTRDLGSSFSPSLAMEEEEEEAPVSIEVKKDGFSAGSSKKPKDLGSFSKDRKKRVFVSPQTEEEEEADQQAIASSYARPSFEPNSSKKPSAPQNRRKPEVNRKPLTKEETEEEKEVAPSYEKPSFEPNVKAKRESPFAPSPSFTNQRRYASKEEERPSDEAKGETIKEEEPVYVFSPRKDVPSSRTIINDPSLMFVARKFVREGNLAFSKPLKELDASHVEFFAIKEEEKKPLLDKAISASLSSWDLLALNVEPNGMPHSYLLSNKEDPSLCACFELNEDKFSLSCLTHNGVAIEDPSLDYAALRLLCFPKQDA